MGTSHIEPMHPLGSLEGRFQGTLGPVRYGPWPHDPICLRACRSPTGQKCLDKEANRERETSGQGTPHSTFSRANI